MRGTVGTKPVTAPRILSLRLPHAESFAPLRGSQARHADEREAEVVGLASPDPPARFKARISPLVVDCWGHTAHGSSKRRQGDIQNIRSWMSPLRVPNPTLSLALTHLPT